MLMLCSTCATSLYNVLVVVLQVTCLMLSLLQKTYDMMQSGRISKVYWLATCHGIAMQSGLSVFPKGIRGQDSTGSSHWCISDTLIATITALRGQIQPAHGGGPWLGRMAAPPLGPAPWHATA